MSFHGRKFLRFLARERGGHWWVTKAVDSVFKTLLPFLVRDRAGTKKEKKKKQCPREGMFPGSFARGRGRHEG